MSLRDIFAALKKFVRDIVNRDKNYTKKDFASELEEIRLELTHGFQDTQREYRRLVHKFYKTYNPFNTGDTAKDLREYRQLIVYSLAAGDVELFSLSKQEDQSNLADEECCLLDRWGVEFPSKKPSVLAEGSLDYYCEVFTFLCQDDQWQHFRSEHNLPDSARVYYEYLSKKMSIALS